MEIAGWQDRVDARGQHPAGWRIVRTAGFERWTAGLDPERRSQVEAAIRRVERDGPALGRPRVDSLKGSRVHNLKELRIQGGVRVLLAFDPNRCAVMLVGGNKLGRTERWYRQFIPLAERAYGQHLRSIGKEDPCLKPVSPARSSATRSR